MDHNPAPRTPAFGLSSTQGNCSLNEAKVNVNILDIVAQVRLSLTFANSHASPPPSKFSLPLDESMGAMVTSFQFYVGNTLLLETNVEKTPFPKPQANTPAPAPALAPALAPAPVPAAVPTVKPGSFEITFNGVAIPLHQRYLNYRVELTYVFQAPKLHLIPFYGEGLRFAIPTAFSSTVPGQCPFTFNVNVNAHSPLNCVQVSLNSHSTKSPQTLHYSTTVISATVPSNHLVISVQAQNPRQRRAWMVEGPASQAASLVLSYPEPPRRSADREYIFMIEQTTTMTSQGSTAFRETLERELAFLQLYAADGPYFNILGLTLGGQGKVMFPDGSQRASCLGSANVLAALSRFSEREQNQQLPTCQSLYPLVNELATLPMIEGTSREVFVFTDREGTTEQVLDEIRQMYGLERAMVYHLNQQHQVPPFSLDSSSHHSPSSKGQYISATWPCENALVEADKAAAAAAAAARANPPPKPLSDESFPPLAFCPITQDVMRDPVNIRCGHLFERRALLKWLKTHSACPFCNHKGLTATDVFPCFPVKAHIESIYQQHGVPVPRDQEEDSGDDAAVRLSFVKAPIAPAPSTEFLAVFSLINMTSSGAIETVRLTLGAHETGSSSSSSSSSDAYLDLPILKPHCPANIGVALHQLATQALCKDFESGKSYLHTAFPIHQEMAQAQNVEEFATRVLQPLIVKFNVPSPYGNIRAVALPPVDRLALDREAQRQERQEARRRRVVVAQARRRVAQAPNMQLPDFAGAQQPDLLPPGPPEHPQLHHHHVHVHLPAPAPQFPLFHPHVFPAFPPANNALPFQAPQPFPQANQQPFPPNLPPALPDELWDIWDHDHLREFGF